MDFNLSSICDMLGDRIEEYKTTSKKRRIERGSCVSKAKIARFTRENQTADSMKKHGKPRFASTPVETPKTDSHQFSTLAMFSSINKLKINTARSLRQNVNIEPKKLIFDEDHCTEDGEKSKMDDSPVRFTSATKTSLDSLKKRHLQRLQRTKVIVRKLNFDDNESNDDSFHDSGNIEDDLIVKCVSQNCTNTFEDKTDGLSEDSVSVTKLKTVVTSLNTPKRERLLRKCMNARKLNFDDVENKDASLSNEENSDQSLPNFSVLTTSNLDIDGMDFSTTMVLNVGISIRPIRELYGGFAN